MREALSPNLATDATASAWRGDKRTVSDGVVIAGKWVASARGTQGYAPCRADFGGFPGGVPAGSNHRSFSRGPALFFCRSLDLHVFSTAIL